MELLYKDYNLIFNTPIYTSRGCLNVKKTFILKLYDEDKLYLAECPLFKNLSYDDIFGFRFILDWVCSNIDRGFDYLYNSLYEWPSIKFGIEQLKLNYNINKNFDNYNIYNPLFFDSDFFKGRDFIKINGLIWVGNKKYIYNQIDDKLKQGYDVIKFKIGLNIKEELEIIQYLRNRYSDKYLQIRVDANGAFAYNDNIYYILDKLENLKIHSIEQPIKKGQIEYMKILCKNSPVDIALDEELIGIFNPLYKRYILEYINPKYIIIKPGLLGGITESMDWINIAKKNGIKYWVTSSLESNIGLNYIAQWTYVIDNNTVNGLGTGLLYKNNFPTNINLEGHKMFIRHN